MGGEMTQGLGGLRRVHRLEGLLSEVRSSFRDDGAIQIVKADLIERIDAALADKGEWPAEIRRSDTRTIISFLMRDCGPHLLSELEAQADRPIYGEFQDMVRDGLIEACFPEAAPGNSGRQFWRWAHVTLLPYQKDKEQ